MLYRWSVAADHQRKFIRQWRRTTRELRQSGALGCWLMRAENGEFVGLVRWPSEYARAQARKAAIAAALPGISALAEAKLSVEEDTLSGFPAALGLAL